MLAGASARYAAHASSSGGVYRAPTDQASCDSQAELGRARPREYRPQQGDRPRNERHGGAAAAERRVPAGRREAGNFVPRGHEAVATDRGADIG